MQHTYTVSKYPYIILVMCCINLCYIICVLFFLYIPVHVHVSVKHLVIYCSTLKILKVLHVYIVFWGSSKSSIHSLICASIRIIIIRVPHLLLLELLPEDLTEVLYDLVAVLADALEAGHVLVPLQNPLSFAIVPLYVYMKHKSKV